MNDEAGLKIPKSSILQKEFYKIPVDYVITGQSGDTIVKAVYKKNGSVDYEPCDTTILSFDDGTSQAEGEEKKEKYCYILRMILKREQRFPQILWVPVCSGCRKQKSWMECIAAIKAIASFVR